jgi:hypothetical protein
VVGVEGTAHAYCETNTTLFCKIKAEECSSLPHSLQVHTGGELVVISVWGPWSCQAPAEQ